MLKGADCMSDTVMFEIVSLDDDYARIVFKTPADLSKFYENVVNGGKDAILVWIEGNLRRSKLVRNDNISNKITDNKTELTSEELVEIIG
jgi:hypothetical protein